MQWFKEPAEELTTLPHALVIAPDSRVVDGVKKLLSPAPAVSSSASPHSRATSFACRPVFLPWSLGSFSLMSARESGLEELATTADRGQTAQGRGPPERCALVCNVRARASPSSMLQIWLDYH